MNGDLYKRMLDSSIDAIVSVDDKGMFTFWNRAAEAMFGRSADEMIGSQLLDIIPPDMRAKHSAGFARFLSTAKPVLVGKTVEVAAIRKDGSVFPVELSLFADMAGERWTFTAIIRDITLRKKAEDMIMRQNTDLARINTELSALFAVSSSLSHPLELENLLSHALKVVTGLNTLNIEKKGGIFIIDGDRLVLKTHLGHAGAFLRLHDNVMVGQCLCGLAAKTGESVWSANSDTDARHTIRYGGIVPHGHIILPLKHNGGVLGVMYLYLPPDTMMDERAKELLTGLAGQLGDAIYNARLYEKTKFESLEDPLTGLANRRFMETVLERNFSNARKFKTPFAVLMADVDHFKQYNDTHGHQAGDKLLERFARLIMAARRDADTVVRYGGEEFLVIMSATGIDGAVRMAERLRLAVVNDVGVTVSIGVAEYHEGIEGWDELIKEADAALYRAKQTGRNRVEAAS